MSATNRKPELSPKQTPLSSSTGESDVREAYSEPATTETVAEKTLSGNTIAARTRKYEVEYKSKIELLLSAVNSRQR